MDYIIPTLAVIFLLMPRRMRARTVNALLEKIANLIYTIIKKFKPKKEISIAKNANAVRQYDYPYIKKNLFTKSEHAFFKYLNAAAKYENIIVFTKVRLEDFIETTSTEERFKYRGYIKSRHVDFVLCDANTLQILAAVELDDPSHYSAKAQKIDTFKNELFEAVGIELIRVKPGSDFETVAQDIIQELRPEVAELSPLPQNN